MKLIAQATLPNTLDVKVPEGMYRKLVFHYSGTAGAGATMLVGDLGSILVTYRGRQIQRIADVTWLRAINDMEDGVSDVTSAIGAAYSFEVTLNQFFRHDTYNILDVREDDNCRIQCIPAASMAAKLGTGMVSVYGVLAKGNQAYIRQLFQHDINISASTIPEKLPYENLKCVFVENDTANLTRLQVNVDNVNLVDAPRLALLDFTHKEYNIETFAAALPLLGVQLAPTHNLVECLNDQTSLIITGAGVAVLSTVAECVDFTPDAYNRSKSATLAAYNSAVARKSSLGKTRPVRYLAGDVFNVPLY